MTVVLPFRWHSAARWALAVATIVLLLVVVGIVLWTALAPASPLIGPTRWLEAWRAFA